MNYFEYKEYIECDRKAMGGGNYLKMIFFNPCYKLIVNLRRCNYLAGKKWLKLFYAVQRVYYNHLCIKYGCDIPSSVTVGKGFQLHHQVGVVINAQTIIGDNFDIKASAVIGKNERGETPIIGNNVSIGAHALIIGGVHIGDGAMIGAGAIVVHDVPNGAVVICEAAKRLDKR